VEHGCKRDRYEEEATEHRRGEDSYQDQRSPNAEHLLEVLKLELSVPMSGSMLITPAAMTTGRDQSGRVLAA